MDVALRAGVAVLERAISYCLGSLAQASPQLLTRPTPCPGWQLADLLGHLTESMEALREAAEHGRVPLLAPPGRAGGGELIGLAREGAGLLLGAWTSACGDAVLVGGVPATAPLVAGVGAIEVTVHGWDVARACGVARPIPPGLADELLDLAVVLVRPPDRPGRFGRPLVPPAGAPPGDRLLAFLGRTP